MTRDTDIRSLTCSVPRGGGVPFGRNHKAAVKEEDKPLPFLFLRPRFLFQFLAIGTAAFGIPALLVPQFMHPIFTNTGSPLQETFYYYAFVLRELYLAVIFWLISKMPAETLRTTWLPFSQFVMLTHLLIDVFHSEWNPLLQKFMVVTRGTMLALLTIIQLKKIDPDCDRVAVEC